MEDGEAQRSHLQRAQLEPGFSPYWPFTRLGLLDSPQASLGALWPSLVDKIVAWVKSASGIHHHGRGVEEGAELVPLVWNGSLRVVPLKAAPVPLGGGNARLLGPTTAGWEEFLRRMPAARCWRLTSAPPRAEQRVRPVAI